MEEVHMGEKNVLVSHLSDKLRYCRERDCIQSTHFLDSASLSEAKHFCKSEKARAIFFGGYEDAERVICVFIPDFYPSDMFPSYFFDKNGEQPLKAVRCTWAQGSPKLSHRDILGSMLALGITREATGDILVSETSADIFVLPQMVDFLISHYEKAGKTPISVREISLSEVMIPRVNIERMRDTVTSMRLDCVLSAIYSLSRAKTEEAVSSGIAYVNDTKILKPDATVKNGDKIVLRGMGKAKIISSDGISKKGKTIIIFDRYR